MHRAIVLEAIGEHKGRLEDEDAARQVEHGMGASRRGVGFTDARGAVVTDAALLDAARRGQQHGGVAGAGDGRALDRALDLGLAREPLAQSDNILAGAHLRSHGHDGRGLAAKDTVRLSATTTLGGVTR
jgi:hypothetical protein